jgi:hypothetical protein
LLQCHPLLPLLDAPRVALALDTAQCVASSDAKVANRDIRVWHGATKTVLE